MNHSPTPWVRSGLSKPPPDGIGADYDGIVAGSTECIITVHTSEATLAKYGREVAQRQLQANADLIEACVNACAAVNPEDPAAVAEALLGMGDVLDWVAEAFHCDEIPLWAKEVIAKHRRMGEPTEMDP